jgi:hypothetical protein
VLIGQTIFLPSSGSPSATYFGPWIPRQGDAFTAVVQILNAFATTGWTVTVKLETKDNEQDDGSALPLGSYNMTAVGTQSSKFTGCLELVRYRFECASGGTARWLHLRCNPIIWNPN